MTGTINGQGIEENLAKILEGAERGCTDLLLDALKARDSVALELAGSAIIRIREILDELKRRRLCHLSIEENPVSEGSPPPISFQDLPLRRKVLPAQGKKKQYPSFYAKDGALVKVGWSKKAKATYEHKLSKESFDHIVDLIADRVSRSGKPFAAEEIIDASQSCENGSPSYQIYLALGFLVDREVLVKDGRRGYFAKGDPKQRGMEAWGAVG